MIVIGDVHPSDVFAMVKHYFGSIPEKALPVSKKKTEVPSYGLRQIAVKRPAQLPWVVMGYNVPTLAQLPQQDQWQAYALYVASAVLSEENSGRFAQQLMRQQQLVAEASSWYSPFFSLSIFVGDGSDTCKRSVD